MELEEIKIHLEQHGQIHLLKFWEQLTSVQQEILLKQLKSVNFTEVLSYFKTAQESLNEEVQKLDERMKPVAADRCGSALQTSQEQLEACRLEGLRRVANDQVGVLLMAGGQGTRLGVSYPKGMYKVGLLSGKSLFEIQAHRIRRLENLACERIGKRGHITWYIMTSEHTMAPTAKYFDDNNYFGLEKDNVVMFEQGKLPCFDFEGRILLSSKYEIAQAPDGNGGMYRALRDRGMLADMKSRGVMYLHVHSVDNILIQVADPVFIGYCIKKNADCAAKVVKKASPTEAVGVVCMVDNSYQVVEYSEITQATAELCDPATGQLLFNAGNICNHFFTLEFLERIGMHHETSLKLHVAKKKIPYVDEKGQLIKPIKPNGIKVEKFVFDVFQFAEMFVTWEVERDAEFSALKNADEAGIDCPMTARRDLYALHKTYLEAAGGKIDGCEIEFSPLLSYSGEGLRKIVEGKTFKSPLLLHSPDEA